MAKQNWLKPGRVIGGTKEKRDPWELTKKEYDDIWFYQPQGQTRVPKSLEKYLPGNDMRDFQKSHPEMFGNDWYNNHRYFVAKALSEGKPVHANVLKEYPELKPKEYAMDKGQLIKEIMTYVPKDSDKYQSTEKSLGALHTYELRDSLIALKKEHPKKESKETGKEKIERIRKKVLEQNAAIHAWYDENPRKDKFRKRKTIRRRTPTRRAIMIRR